MTYKQQNCLICAKNEEEILVEQSKKKIGIDCTALGSRRSSPVHINEHLTRHGKQLLGAAIQRKKEAHWKFVWITEGKVFSCRNESSAVLKITTASDLAKTTIEAE